MAHATTAHVVSRPLRITRRERRDDTLAPGDRVGGWCVEREIGRGGMSSVHAAVDTRGARAAIKIAHRGALDEHLTARVFVREARVIDAVAHPATARVLATGSHDGRPYLALELLVGAPLGALVEVGRVMPRLQALDLLLELVDVLAAAHARGIIHRDVKLDNVFVTDAPHDGPRVRLLDWGVAHVIGEADPFRGTIAGTLSYVAPEQILGDSIGPACDVYALAVVAYRLLCGRAPFIADRELAIVAQHLHNEPPRPRALRSSIPSDLDELFVAMLAKAPAARPSLDDVARVLRAARERAAPTPTRRRWWQASARRGDVLGRPALPMPRLSLAWIAAAGALIGFAELVRALP
jgi:serine/threonine-protein kinase